MPGANSSYHLKQILTDKIDLDATHIALYALLGASIGSFFVPAAVKLICLLFGSHRRVLPIPDMILIGFSLNKGPKDVETKRVRTLEGAAASLRSDMGDLKTQISSLQMARLDS